MLRSWRSLIIALSVNFPVYSKMKRVHYPTIYALYIFAFTLTLPHLQFDDWLVYISIVKLCFINMHPCILNPYHAELLKWNNPPYIFGTIHYHFNGYQNENLKLVSHQYRAWSDCTDVQPGLALYWWQRQITIGVDRIRVNKIYCKTDVTRQKREKISRF